MRICDKSIWFPFLLLLSVLCFGTVSAAAPPLELHGAVVSDEAVEITWKVDWQRAGQRDTIYVRYNRVFTLSKKGEQWLYAPPVAYTQGHLELAGLKDGTEYIYQVGVKDGSGGKEAGISWGERQRFETKIPWGPIRLLFVIGALALFIFGMKTMSEGLQAAAGIRLRKILESMTRNRFAGILSGFLLTGILQSSSATTVMTVSFVNAGLITLAQSAGIMMGANLGTTVTGWIVSLLGFRVDVTTYALAVLAVASPLLLMRRIEWRSWGTSVIGFALMFMALGYLKANVPVFSADSPTVEFIMSYAEVPVMGTLLFIVLGAFITIVVQSSSTSITLTMTLCASGVIPFEAAAAMVLGENIGTTSTAEIAALAGNVHARRSARIHTLFNLFGVVWMVFFIPVVLREISAFLPADPYATSEAGLRAATIGLAAFHTVFNLVNLLLLIWFVPWLVKLASRMVPSRGNDETFRLEYIETPLQVSEIALVEARQEVIKFADLTFRMCQQVKKLLTETDLDEQKRMHKRVMKYEKITDRMEFEIAQYCANISRTELSQDASERIRAILSISNDLERIGDVFYHMSRAIEKKNASRIWFLPDQRIKLMEMFDIVNKAFAKMLVNLSKDETAEIDIAGAKALEQQLNKMYNVLKKEYIVRMETGNYKLRSGTIYNDLFSSLEKAGDHIINVSEALVGEV